MIIRPAKFDELDEIYQLFTKNPDSGGYVLKVFLSHDILKHSILVAVEDDTIIGFCQFNSRKDGVCVIYEIVVDRNHRHKSVGRKLVDALPKPIFLKCPITLEANNFYASYGFILIGQEKGRKTPLNHWYLPNPKQNKLF